MKTEPIIYILEFKVDGKGSALEQVRARKYQEKYLHEKRTVYLIGINFDAEEKTSPNLRGKR